jgi:zinc transport system permease protein
VIWPFTRITTTIITAFKAMPPTATPDANMTEIIFPLLGGVLTALVAGPLGSLLLWRRMAYFGDSLAHASLFGVAIALMLDMPMGTMVAIVCLGVALLLSRLMRSSEHGVDTWLTIMAYTGMSLALLMTASHSEHDGHALEDYLFGNLLSLSSDSIAWMCAGLAVVALLLWRHWTGLVAAAIHEEAAAVDGWPVDWLRPLLLLLLAAVVAAGAKVMGVLLISALMVIPAAAARYLARTPGQMAIRASIIAVLCMSAAVLVGQPLHLPIAALVVLFALTALLLSWLLQRWQRRQLRA